MKQGGHRERWRSVKRIREDELAEADAAPNTAKYDERSIGGDQISSKKNRGNALYTTFSDKSS